MVLEKGHYIVEEQFLEIIDEQFGMKLIIEEIKKDFSYFVDDYKVMNDKSIVCSKVKAISIVSDFFDLKNPYLDIYISKNIINNWEVIDTFNKGIFSDSQLMQGWFIWVDPCNIANWSHECYYYFVVNNDCVIKSDETWYPNEKLIIEKV